MIDVDEPRGPEQVGEAPAELDIDPELWEAWADMDVRVAQDAKELKRLQQKIQQQISAIQ